jgi:hypothetical protein
MKEKIIKNKKAVCIIIAAAMILVYVSYSAGYQKGKKITFSQGPGSGFSGANSMRNRGAGIINGDVTSKDETSMTVRGRDGSSKIVLYSGTTQIMKSTTGTSSDVAVGTQVMIQGKTNSDGSITAQSIQIRPEMPKITQPSTTPVTQ